MKERISKTVMYDIGRMAVIALIGIIYYQSSPTTTDAAQTGREKADRRTWQEVIDKWDFVNPDENSVLVKSLKQVSDCTVRLFYDANQGSGITYTFSYMGKDAVTLQGHMSSSFASHDKVLYFAQYPPNSVGCTVLAIDLESGKTLWETSLHLKLIGHSGYSNVVALRLANIGQLPEGKAAVVITGSESYRDYVEVLDCATGESLAIKKYRVGF